MKKLWTGHKINPITDYVNLSPLKCDLDLGGRDTGVTHDISSYHCDNLCQVFSKSLDL
jgi:hypothetical protein